MNRKSIPAGRVTIKNADEGIVDAVFATLGVIDKDGDVILKGAIESGAKVTMSAYGHKSWEGVLPVGIGTITEVGNEAIVTAQFFMDTPHGRDTFTTVKNLAAEGLGEWSFSLKDIESERGEVDGKSANLISAVTVHEVSPVLLGAGVDTRTLVTKGAKFSEHADAVLADVDELITRATEVVTLREAQGKKGTSESAAAQLTKVNDALTRLKALLDEPTTDVVVDDSDNPPHTDDDAAAVEAFLAEMVRFDVEISQGVTT
jgi:hypothetical protein